MNDQDVAQHHPPGHHADSHDVPDDGHGGGAIGGGIAYELRIGVTGHRELENRNEVRQAVQDAIEDLISILTGASRDPLGPHGSPQSFAQRFDRWLARCLSAGTKLTCPVVNWLLRLCKAPDRWLWPVVPVAPPQPTVDQQTPLKLTGISCLAIGSDQILIEVIDQLLKGQPRPGLVPAQRRNRYVEAVLPFQQEEYEKNYSAEDCVKFRQLLELDRGKYQTQAEPTVIYPDFPSDGHQGTLDANSAYRAASEYMVNTSEIIIAVWDSDHNEEPGGTGKTARYAISRGKTVVWIDPKNLKRSPVVLRATAPESDDAGGATEWERLSIDAPEGLKAFKLPQRAKTLSPNFHRLAAYNRDAALTASEFLKSLKFDEFVFLKQAAGKLPPAVVPVITQRILPHVVRADRLSNRYRDLRNVAAWLWPTVAAFAVSIIGFQIFFLPQQHWIAWIELALLVMCLIAYRVSVYDAWHDKWLNDRRLAEGLRTVLYSSLVTPSELDDLLMHEDALSEVQNPLPFYSAEQSWLVGAIKRIVRRERYRFEKDIDLSDEKVFQGVRKFVTEEWIGGEINYHTYNVHRQEGKVKKYERLHLLVMASIAIVSVMHAIGVGHHNDHDPQSSRFTRLDIWIALFTGALPAWAAAVHALSTAEDHERLAERSRRMVRLLTRLKARMTGAGSPAELRDCVHQAEDLFDLENQEWAESLADRRPVPSG